jgi:hypothetical protein
MKKTLLILAGVAGYAFSYAQQPEDALRLSWYVPGGSARTQAVGGAMGSLGGDITAGFVNPAGLAFFKTGDFVLTPIYQFQKTKATYLDHTEQDKMNRFTWGTTGFVMGNGSDNKGNVRNVAFSLAFNRTADFNGDYLYRGENNQSSFSQKYVEELNNSGIRDSRIETEFPLGASLVYNTHWADAMTNSSGQIDHFITNAPIYTGLLQQYKVKNRGGINEFSLGMAVNLKDKWMIGGSLGVPIVNYKSETEFTEADATDNPNNNFDYGMFSDKVNNSGVGFNLKAGVIYKPAEFWRVGLAFHTPTLYSLNYKYEAAVVLNDDVPDSLAWTDESTRYTNGQASEFKYLLVTPYRIIGSISYVIREVQDVTKQRGFLTADVEYVNHSASSYKPDEENTNDQETEDYLKGLNHAIDQAYKGALNFRVGGELKFTTLMVRLGAAYYGNPYKNINGEKGSKLNLSGGLGYRNKGFFVDLTYVQGINKDVSYAYRLETAPYTGANLKNTAGTIFATVGFKF